MQPPVVFLRDEVGRRTGWGGAAKFQNDPHWRDEILFHGYLHGDDGAGIGTSHQIGGTSLVANSIGEWPKKPRA